MIEAPPRTYAEWATALDRFEAGDDTCLAVMERGTLEWSAGVAERFVRRVDAVYTARLKALQNGLQRALKLARRPDDVSRGLSDARRALIPLARMAALPAFRPDVQEHLRASLEQLVKGIQTALEQSARAEGHASERLLGIVLTTPLRLPDALPPPEPVTSPQSDAATSAPSVPRRRIIL